jgi:hypothetical protein
MMTRKPLNINDSELFDGMSRDERPQSEPTAMSYFMHRTKLAEISRSMVDRTVLSISNSGEPSYNDIMDCDTELQILENDIPQFWTMSTIQLIERYNMTIEQADRIRYQSHSVYFFIYTARLKWHLPYFTRALTNPVYSASRQICVSYASKIIKLQTSTEHKNFRQVTCYYFTFLILGVFMSSVVLLMDLCGNRSSPNYDKQREEVVEAFRLLEDSKEESEIAAQFVSTLMNILQKHKVGPPMPSHQSTSQPISPALAEHYQTTSASGIIGDQLCIATQCSLGVTSSKALIDTASTMDFSTTETWSGDLASCFGEFTQSFKNGGGDVGSLDWNDFFSDLNFPSFI